LRDVGCQLTWSMDNSKLPLISRDELQTRLDRGDKFTLVEALPPPAFRDGHIPGAINLPPVQVQDLASKRLPDKSADIVVYCAGPT
jgi:rhodanese-related sulfurtransferase